jgi:predicted SAM-dependent methyltransferase
MFLNVGCGSRFHPDWVNLDVAPSSSPVRACDLNKGIPFPDGTFEVIYHSHVLEHFPKEDALRFMRECFRVIAPRGVIRIAVPDLERIAQTYLRALDRAASGDEQWQHHYEWIMLEMYDQIVRERSGGAMLEYLKRNPIPNEAFVYERNGAEARRMVQSLRNRPPESVLDHSRSRGLLARARRVRQACRTALRRLLLGRADHRMLSIARFRASGEIHHWMYDRYSLQKLLESAGFQDAKVVGATESRIPRWASYNLDTEPDGTVYKPDSIYMEAIKLCS